MKRARMGWMLAAVSAAALTAAPAAQAGQRQWATAGKILAGVVIGQAIAGGPVYACPPPPVVYYPPPPVVYYPPPPVVYYPPPVVYVPPPRPVYVPPCPPPRYRRPPCDRDDRDRRYDSRDYRDRRYDRDRRDRR